MVDSATASTDTASTKDTASTGTPTTTTTPDPAAAMLFFFIVTSIHCVIGILMGGGTTMQNIIMKLSYILFVIIGEYFINLNLSNSMCGVKQWRSTLFITIVPWLLIFGTMQLFVTIFPGWMSPFSNTFGYMVAKLMGLPELMKLIVMPQGTGDVERALLSVTTDDSLLINQFSTENVIETTDKNGVRSKERPIFDKAWKSLQDAGIINKFATDAKENESYRKKLYKFVEMKYTISDYVWNMLTGLLVTSVSYNYIVNTGCEQSAKDMIDRYNAYEASERSKRSKKNSFDQNQPSYKPS
jgi:hypothetical protein